MGQAVPESDLPDSLKGTAVPESDLPKGAAVPEDMSKYKDHPISTFAANALNALTFGLPDYLNKTFTPQTYAEGQKYQEANPMAANLGTATGNVAGYAVPAGYGLVKGGQLGAKAVGALGKKFAPELASNEALASLAKLYGRAVGASTGGTMGAQTGAALPGVIQGDPGKAVAASQVVNQYANQIPGVSPLGGVSGYAVPAAAGMAASGVNAITSGFTKELTDLEKQKRLGR